MVVGCIITCVISAYQVVSLNPDSWRGVLDTTLCDKVCQWLVAGQWFSPGTPASSNNKTDHHDITGILSKVALDTINQTQPSIDHNVCWQCICKRFTD